MTDQQTIDALAGQPVPPQGLFIDGRFVDAAGGATLDVISPIDGRPLTTIADAAAGDVDRAVGAARKTFDGGSWASMPPAGRREILLRLAELIDRDALVMAVLGVRDNGTEIGMALKAEPGSAAATFRYYAEAIDKVYGEIAPVADNYLGLVHRRPVGVVGAIIPWNFPLMIGAWKLAPALAAGNSVVLKPAEGASLTSLHLAALAREAGLPDGALNVVTGQGEIAGDALAGHMDVDVLAFTGSGSVGRKLLRAAARSNLKRVYLELGGKSPNIVFADAPDLDAAVRGSANGMFRNSGQVCVAASRLLLEDPIHDEFVERLIAVTEAMKIGDPLRLDTAIGAISSREQLTLNLSCIDGAIKDGASLRTGGRQIHIESGGYYLQPAVFTGVTPDMPIAREEIFGPVLAVLRFNNPDEAIDMANDSDYGLASGVWTSNLSLAHTMTRRLKAGVVHVNCYGGTDITVPLGGLGQSGNGYDKSLHALEKYTVLKTAWIAL